jgi:hypothetical protein
MVPSDYPSITGRLDGVAPLAMTGARLAQVGWRYKPHSPHRYRRAFGAARAFAATSCR